MNKSIDDVAAQIRRVRSGVSGFAADMRKQGIHVGMGRDPHCVTCGEAWPCPDSARGTHE